MVAKHCAAGTLECLEANERYEVPRTKRIQINFWLHTVRVRLYNAQTHCDAKLDSDHHPVTCLWELDGELERDFQFVPPVPLNDQKISEPEWHDRWSNAVRKQFLRLVDACDLDNAWSLLPEVVEELLKLDMFNDEERRERCRQRRNLSSSTWWRYGIARRARKRVSQKLGHRFGYTSLPKRRADIDQFRWPRACGDCVNPPRSGASEHGCLTWRIPT